MTSLQMRLRGDGPLSKVVGVLRYEDAAEKILRWPGASRVAKGHFRGKVDPIVLQERELLFIHVPKNAGTSVSESVYGRSVAHRSALFYKIVAPDVFDNTETFALLRDPVDRFVSSFWFIRQGGGEEVRMDPRFSEVCRGVETLDDLLTLVDRLRDQIYLLDNSLRAQSWYVCDGSGKPIVPHLFIMGEQDEALARFLADHGKPALAHRNATRKGTLHVTDAHRNRILSLYAADVRLIEGARHAGLTPFPRRASAGVLTLGAPANGRRPMGYLMKWNTPTWQTSTEPSVWVSPLPN